MYTHLGKSCMYSHQQNKYGCRLYVCRCCWSMIDEHRGIMNVPVVLCSDAPILSYPFLTSSNPSIPQCFSFFFFFFLAWLWLSPARSLTFPHISLVWHICWLAALRHAGWLNIIPKNSSVVVNPEHNPQPTYKLSFMLAFLEILIKKAQD